MEMPITNWFNARITFVPRFRNGHENGARYGNLKLSAAAASGYE